MQLAMERRLKGNSILADSTSIAALVNELRKPQYSDLGDQQAAESINDKSVLINRSVPIHDLKQYAIFQNIWPKLKAGQLSDQKSVADLCESVLDWIEDSRTQSIDVSMPEVQVMIASLVSAGVLTQSQADEVIAMGITSIPWTQSVGLPEVGIGLVRNARKEIAGAE